jgi:methionine-rich copper-binding protein CopC
VRRIVVAVAAFFALAATPATALAHAGLNEADPPTGGKASEVPDDVILFMSETPVEAATEVAVFDGCSEPVVESVSTHNKEVHAEILGEAQPGRWRVEYQTLSAEDGHTTSGKYRFKVTGTKDCSVFASDEEGTGGDEPPDDDEADEEGSDFPVVPVVIGAGALIGIAALARGASGKP